ncbi:MAG TPA: hypothetical protein PK498_06785, partial [Candidatus Kapabacteria bacterium]|nr:hypothetical protein [Candidatus Kapabacteria bacterium]
MKKLITLCILMLLQVSIVFSQVIDNKGLYFERAGQRLSNDYFSPREIIEIPKLDAKYYHLPR